MAFVFPSHVTRQFKGWTRTTFSLSQRQAMSVEAGGGVNSATLSEPLWVGNFVFANVGEVADLLLSELESLQGQPLYVHNDERPGPADMGGATPSIHSIAATNRSVRITGLPPGHIFKPRDFFTIELADGVGLYSVARGGTVSGTGLSPWMDLTTFVRPTVAVGQVVEIQRPYMEAKVIPGSIEQEHLSGAVVKQVSFQAVEYVR